MFSFAQFVSSSSERWPEYLCSDIYKPPLLKYNFITDLSQSPFPLLQIVIVSIHIYSVCMYVDGESKYFIVIFCFCWMRDMGRKCLPCLISLLQNVCSAVCQEPTLSQLLLSYSGRSSMGQQAIFKLPDRCMITGHFIFHTHAGTIVWVILAIQICEKGSEWF